MTPAKKVIIDTDPGIDDAMAIFLAFNSPELEVIGLTTTFGNVRTTMATYNALHLCDFAGRDDIPVSQGLLTSLRGLAKERIAYFVHGDDGLGNTNPLPPKRTAIEQGAPEFLIQKVKEYPGEITVVALGPLTNIAKAIEDDPTFAQNVGQIVVLGGAFFVNGNVSPAAEANVFGDPEAADIVFTSGADVLVIGIDITHKVFFNGMCGLSFLGNPMDLSQQMHPLSLVEVAKLTGSLACMFMTPAQQVTLKVKSLVPLKCTENGKLSYNKFMNF